MINLITKKLSATNNKKYLEQVNEERGKQKNIFIFQNCYLSSIN